MSASRQQQIAIVQYCAAPAWFDQRGGIILFDDRGPAEGQAGRHRRRDDRSSPAPANRAPATRIARCGLRGSASSGTIGAFVQMIAASGAMHRAEVDDRRGLLGGMTVDTIVQLQEIAIQRVQADRLHSAASGTSR